MNKKAILSVRNLEISFSQYTKGLRRIDSKAINNLDIDLYKGEILAVVGSSGSGKSLLAHSILGILPTNSKTRGDIYYKDEILDEKRKEKLRGKEIVFIPQSVNYLDPLMEVGKQVKISIKDKKKSNTILERVFRKYNLDKKVEKYYPFQLSGGMARKVLLSSALVSNAEVIIADEPTPGLDEKSLNEALKDFRDLADNGCAVLIITHDISAALKIADRVAIFYGGTTLEVAKADDFKNNGENLRHPYTKALYNALPNTKFTPIGGSQPLASELPTGCLFYDRCEKRTPDCENIKPEMKEIRDGKVRCLYAT